MSTNTQQTTDQTVDQATHRALFHVGDDADRALKARHATMWALGDFPSVAHRVIPHLGADLVEAAGVRAGQHVLDVGAGAGNAAIPAAVRGATVVASDLTPQLLDAGRAEAEAFGPDVAGRLDWQVADAEQLPYDDASFDVVLSCVGCMFAPHHEPTAAELTRVCRPGGTIALANWTPEGFIGRLFATMKPFAAPPPPGAQPPPLWGTEGHVRALLGDRVSALSLERRPVRVEGFTSGAQWRDLFKAAYGPTVAAYAALADRPDDVAVLDAALAALGDDALANAATPGVMEWEYLLVVATRT